MFNEEFNKIEQDSEAVWKFWEGLDELINEGWVMGHAMHDTQNRQEMYAMTAALQGLRNMVQKAYSRNLDRMTATGYKPFAQVA